MCALICLFTCELESESSAKMFLVILIVLHSWFWCIELSKMLSKTWFNFLHSVLVKKITSYSGGERKWYDIGDRTFCCFIDCQMWKHRHLTSVASGMLLNRFWSFVIMWCAKSIIQFVREWSADCVPAERRKEFEIRTLILLLPPPELAFPWEMGMVPRRRKKETGLSSQKSVQ